MVSFRSAAAASLVFFSAASAHFVLVWPPGTEGTSPDEDGMGTAPCGGKAPGSSTSAGADFHVGGDSVAMTLLHPQATWLFRGMLGSDASKNNLSEWTELVPFVQQSGAGDFCEPGIAVPSDWAGKKGTITVTADSPDGVLYQCAVVNFVSGTNSSHSCSNGSSVTGTYVSSDATLATIVPSAATASSSASGGANKGNAAAGLHPPTAGALASVAAVLSMAIFGAALL